MPVLSEHRNPATFQAATDSSNTSSTSGAYLFISLAILLTLGISISRRQSTACTTKPNNSFCKTKTSLSNARIMMQEPTPPSSASSALPEKPYLLQPEAMEHHHQQQQQQQVISDTEKQQSYSPQRQPFDSHDSQQLHTTSPILPAKLLSNHQHVHPFHQSRLGSLPAGPTSLLHPQPPSPTIAMASNLMRIQTQISHPNPNQNQHQPQQQNQQGDQPQTVPGQYTQNDMVFVPSPTEYASFEALYSKFPPQIYDSPNPASYASTTFSPDSQDSTLPRRRSYMRTLSNGAEVSGEIIVGGSGVGAEGGQWRRHTKVFGGGVCMACEESERRRLTV